MEQEPLKVIAGAPDKPLVVGDIEIRCYVIEDGTRVLSQRGMLSGLGISGRGVIQEKGGTQLPRFAASQSLAPHIKGETRAALNNPVQFSYEGTIAYGYPAVLLPDLCDAYLSARLAGDLRPQQLHIAERCELLIRGFARIGIIALVDEVTGYQAIRSKRALAEILERFIAEDLQEWTKTFPDEFYHQIYRLNGWGEFHRAANCYPVVGHYTNDVVYERLAPGVLDELREKNPLMPEGYRRHRHHQFLTPAQGHPKLKEHLAGVIALMRSHERWDEFIQSLSRAFPKRDEQIAMTMGNYWFDC